MTIKYLYMIGADTFDDTFKYFHIPIDNYVFDGAGGNLMKISIWNIKNS